MYLLRLFLSIFFFLLDYCLKSCCVVPHALGAERRLGFLVEPRCQSLGGQQAERSGEELCQGSFELQKTINEFPVYFLRKLLPQMVL